MKMRKFIAIILALVMVFAISVNAFAAENNANSDTVTVKFTYNYSYNYDDTYTWTPANGSDLFTTNSTVTVDLDTLNNIALNTCKTQYSLPAGHAMTNTVSVLDVVVAAALSTGHTVIGGWDEGSEDSVPGGYLYNIDNRNLMFEYGDSGYDDGTVWMSGEGFVIGIAPNATATPTFSDVYLSNVAASTLADDAVIYVDLGTYFFSRVAW